MEAIQLHRTYKARSVSNGALWTGRIVSAVCILFLLADAVMKIVREHHSVEGTTQLGWSDGSVQGIGILLLVCTVLYIIPRTAVLGALLLTAYMGGAIATIARVGIPWWFPFIFGILIWAGLLLRDKKLRMLLSVMTGK